MSEADALRIEEGGLDDPRVEALILAHTTRARAETAICSAHSLDASGLSGPDISFFAAWRGEEALAIGALRLLTPDLAEVKSMFTAQTARGQGVASAMLNRIVEEARAKGAKRLSLETGAWDYFRPSHALYTGRGFTPCGPFHDYGPDPNSLFFTLALEA